MVFFYGEDARNRCREPDIRESIMSNDPAIALRNWIGLATLVVIWGSSFAITKIAVAGLSPVWIVAYRLVIGAVLLLAVALWRKEHLTLTPLYLVWYLALALIGTVGPFFLISWGVARTDSTIAGILMAMVPLFAIGLAHIYLHDEPLTKRRGLGFGIGFIGLLVVIGVDRIAAIDFGDGAFLGELALVGAAFCYAAHGVMARRAPPMTPVQLALGEIGIGAVIALVIGLAVDPSGYLPATTSSATAAAWLGIFPTAIAGLVLFWLLKRAGVGFVAYCNYLIPVFAAGLGVAALGEKLTVNVLVGLAVILCGIAVSETRKMPRGQFIKSD